MDRHQNAELGLTFHLRWWWPVWFWWADLRSVRTVWFWLRFAAGLAPLQRLPGASASSFQDSPRSSCSPCICRWTNTWSLPNANRQQNDIWSYTQVKTNHIFYMTLPHSLQCANTHLITLAVVFQTARFLTVAAFAVSPVWLSFFAFANLGLKSHRVSV